MSVIDNRGKNNLNIWKAIAISDSKIIDRSLFFHRTGCLSEFTSELSNYKTTNFKFNVTLKFNIVIDEHSTNHIMFTPSQYTQYLNLIKEYHPFKYRLKYHIEDKMGSINLIFSGNYTQFMFILTLVRYAWEEPACSKIRHALMFYDYLKKLGINTHLADCINIVLGTFKATHGHETQCLFPYISMGIPLCLNIKNVKNRLYTQKYLTSIYQITGYYYYNLGYKYQYDTEDIESDFDNDLSYYLNNYNKWK